MLVHARTNRRQGLGDRVVHAVARRLLRLPPRVQVRLAGGRPVEVGGERLDPEMQLMLAMRARVGGKPLSADTPERARRELRREAIAHRGRPTPVGAVQELEIPVAHGTLPARHYAAAEPGGPHPLLVWFHGGGYVAGDIEVADEPCRILCRHGGVDVLSVGYSLAPEHPFPAALDDGAAALEWAQAHAGALGADPLRVAVGGDSAGGNLAAIAARESSVRPCLQLLVYPAADMESELPSMELYGEGFYLTRADRDWYHGHYHRDGPSDDPRARPLRAGKLAGLAPAIVVTAAFDPLRDEGEAYAAALREAGTPVLLRRVPGLIHGFMNMTGLSPASRAAAVEIAGALRAMVRA
jgi:acetyl esterase